MVSGNRVLKWAVDGHFGNLYIYICTHIHVVYIYMHISIHIQPFWSRSISYIPHVLSTPGWLYIYVHVYVLEGPSTQISWTRSPNADIGIVFGI